MIRYFIFLLPLWIFSLGALAVGIIYRDSQFASMYMGFGVLGMAVGHVLTEHRRAIIALEKRIAALESDRKGRKEP